MKQIHVNTRFLAESAVSAALICILAPIAVPVGPVPVSLGVFAVMLTGIVLERKSAVYAAVLYIMLGTVGLPVFSGMKAGFAVLTGPTGGYIWSYIPMTYLTAKLSKGTPARAFTGCLLSLAICYSLGTIQFMLTTGADLTAGLMTCVVPFIPFDLLKAACAVRLGVAVRRRTDK